MKKSILILAGLSLSSAAMASPPQFDVKCIEYKRDSVKPVTLYEGTTDLVDMTLASELTPGMHYSFTLSAPGCTAQRVVAHKEQVVVPVPADQGQCQGQGQGQGKGKCEPAVEMRDAYSLEFLPPEPRQEAPCQDQGQCQGQGKGEPAPAVCTMDIVDVLLKRERARRDYHVSHGSISLDGKANLLIKYRTSFWTHKTKVECYVHYAAK